MRMLLIALAAALLVLPATATAKPKPKDGGVTDAQIAEARRVANECMKALGVRPFDVSKARPQGAEYRAWVLRLWQERARTCKTILYGARNNIVTAAVVAFGEYAGQALAVAKCESGHSPNAQNGQYLGAWQMGSSERDLFGHGSDFLSQAMAANRYFVLSGRDWSPWSCKPWN